MSRSTAQVWILALVASFLSCSESPGDHNLPISPSILDTPGPDVTDISTIDIVEDPCVNIQVVDGIEWCTCHPECCRSQLWFCPPVLGEPTYYKKEVVVDVCDENLNTCTYGFDHDCPPPEIIYEGDCTEAYECPPSAQNLDYGWQWCELPDGTMGQQDIKCDKGQLYTSPCQPCLTEECNDLDDDCDGLVDEDLAPGECQNECGIGTSVCVMGVLECFGPQPQEEVCDYLDNDCDGLVDENQLNACEKCGPVPAEECNAFDDDCDGDVDENLIQMCSTACGTGAEACVNGSWAGCTAQQPSPEICDGLDNDCNGQIDDGISCVCTVQDVGKLFPCAEPPLLCGQGYKTCECLTPECTEIVTTECYAACYWLVDPPGSDPNCDAYVGMPLSEEECNAFDDNCNSLIDEDLYTSCYTGPEGTLGVGICEAGSLVCEMGTWGGHDQLDQFVPNLCVEEVVPQDEECNGLDDDCDGETDWGEEVPETDILFIVDWSGSMSGEIDAVLISLNQFASHYSLQDKLHWGLIVGPRQLPGEVDERLFLTSDISPFPDFLSSFAGLGSTGMNTAHEMLLDALYLSMHNISGNSTIDMSQSTWKWNVGESVPPKDQFKVTWRPGANRVIIVFSDEFPQSFLSPQITDTDITNSCIAVPQLKVYTFSTNEVWSWDEIAATCGGKYYQLTNNSTEMYSYLMEILDEICMPPEEN